MIKQEKIINKITQLRAGQTGKIKRYMPDSFYRRQKLLALGLVPGTVFTVIRFAPLGDPIQIWVRGYALSLRKEEALLIEIEKIERTYHEENTGCLRRSH